MSEIPGRADTLCPTRNPPVFCRHEETCRSFDCTRLASEKDERICYLYAAYNNVLTVGVSNPLKSAEKKIRREIPLSPCGRRVILAQRGSDEGPLSAETNPPPEEDFVRPP